MKFKNSKIITAFIAVMLCVAAFSFAVSANTDNDKTALNVNDSVESKTPLSTKGNMTVVDDVHQVTDTTDKNAVEDKQFITVETKNGNIFYIIIDRSGNTENVYFLNAVDETDLFALMGEEEKAEVTPVCTCSDKCELGDVDENCEVCSKDKDKCTGVEKAKPEATTETEQKPQKKSNPFAGILILLILGACSAFYWFKIKNKKPTTKGATDPSEYEEEDEEDTEYEKDPEEEVETEDEPENYDSDEDTDESEDEE